MANPYLVLWCDPTKNKLYSGWMENTEAITPIIKQGDNVGVEIHWVTRPQFGATMQEVEFPPAAAITLGVGRLDSAPLDGTFTVTYDGDTTPDLPYDITASALDAALNDLASITAEGGVSVTKSGNYYRIVWNDRVNYTETFTSNVDALSPTSETQFVYAKEGSATANRIVLMKVRQSVIAGTTSFTATTSPQINISNMFADVWRVEISPAPKDGVFTLTFAGGISPAKTSDTISLTDSASDIQANLEGLEIGSFSVSQVGPFIWDITVPPAATVITAENGLIKFSSFYGVLNMNTAEVDEFLAGAESGTAKLEVQVDVAGEIQTLIQTNVTIINDLIQNSSFELVDLGQVMPVDSVVRYDTSQTLSSAEQLQARQNIDAVGQSEITGFNTDIATLQGQMVVVQGDITSIEAMLDQPVLTTSDVQFNTVTVGTNTVVIDGTSISVSDGTDTVLIETTGITFPDATVQTTAMNESLYLTKAGNLSGIADAMVARGNLGLGTIATAAATDYLSKAGNLSGLASTSTARTNLGLGTMATETASDYLSKAGNLSGISNTATARTNIGLGSSDSVSFTSVNVNSSKVLIDSNGVTFTAPAGIVFSDGTGQNTAGPSKPSDLTLPYVVTWNGSNSFVCGYGTGQLWLDQGSSYQARFGYNNGAYGSGAIEITEDTWTTSMEMNAKGLKFPDGTVQTTATSSNLVLVQDCLAIWDRWEFVGTAPYTDLSGYSLAKTILVSTSSGACIAGLAPAESLENCTIYMKFDGPVTNPYTDQNYGVGLFESSYTVTDAPKIGAWLKESDGVTDGELVFVYENAIGAVEATITDKELKVVIDTAGSTISVYNASNTLLFTDSFVWNVTYPIIGFNENAGASANLTLTVSRLIYKIEI